MNWIKKRVYAGQVLAGTFLNLGAGCIAEMAGYAGLDWVLIDTEHGLGDANTLVSYLQAARAGCISAIVRVIANRSEYAKRALDLGASGIMVPHVNTAQEARYAVSCMKYPPDGIRGMIRTSWASGFGYEAQEYISAANDNVLSIIQIETKEAIDNIDEIASVPGVDVLFVGPSDLSCHLGISNDLADSQMKECIAKVNQAAQMNGKKTGILIKNPDYLGPVIAEGFNMVALETDISIMKNGLNKVANAFSMYKKRRMRDDRSITE